MVILGLLFVGTKDFDRRKTLNAVRRTDGLMLGHVHSADVDDALQNTASETSSHTSSTQT